MDERAIIHAAITHINSALGEFEKFPRSGLNSKSLAELKLACSSLNDSINHCQAIFGPTTLNR